MPSITRSGSSSVRMAMIFWPKSLFSLFFGDLLRLYFWVLFRNSVFSNWSKKKISDNFKYDLEIYYLLVKTSRPIRSRHFLMSKSPKPKLDLERPNCAQTIFNSPTNRGGTLLGKNSRGRRWNCQNLDTTRAISGGNFPLSILSHWPNYDTESN